MTSSNTLKVAAVTSIITFAKSDAEVAQILTWFISDWASPEPQGMTAAQLNQWRLDQANARIVGIVRQKAAQNRADQLRAAQISIDQQAANETAI